MAAAVCALNVGAPVYLGQQGVHSGQQLIGALVQVLLLLVMQMFGIIVVLRPKIGTGDR